MKNNTNLLIRSGLTVVMALVLWLPVQVWSEEPAKEANTMQAAGMENCKAMMEKKREMMTDMKAQDAEFTEQVAQMNSAPEEKKLELIAALITKMVEQQAKMNARRAQMQDEMMQHMTEHMQMGKGPMAQCPMMKGMKGMDAHPAGDPK